MSRPGTARTQPGASPELARSQPARFRTDGERGSEAVEERQRAAKTAAMPSTPSTRTSLPVLFLGLPAPLLTCVRWEPRGLLATLARVGARSGGRTLLATCHTGAGGKETACTPGMPHAIGPLAWPFSRGMPSVRRSASSPLKLHPGPLSSPGLLPPPPPFPSSWWPPWPPCLPPSSGPACVNGIHVLVSDRGACVPGWVLRYHSRLDAIHPNCERLAELHSGPLSSPCSLPSSRASCHSDSPPGSWPALQPVCLFGGWPRAGSLREREGYTPWWWWWDSGLAFCFLPSRLPPGVSVQSVARACEEEARERERERTRRCMARSTILPPSHRSTWVGAAEVAVHT